MSQAGNRKPLEMVSIVIIPKYLFETNGFRIDVVDLIDDKYSITDKLGFGISDCDIIGSFPSPLTT